jgi:ATP-dependent Clp protease ATP-binding subunit ClpA
MYDRFTDRARKVIQQLAKEEAERLNHEYIGTEHILLGLVKEGSSVSANVLKNLGIDLRTVRLEVEKIVEPAPDAVITGYFPQTPRAKNVIEYSIEEAHDLNHSYVGTEHLLLGLLREEVSVAAQLLINLGLQLDNVAEHIHLLLLGCDIPQAVMQRLPTGKKPNMHGMETPDCPSKTRQAMAKLINQIHNLNQQHRTATTEGNFESAAQVREQADKLKRKKHNIIRDWYNRYTIDPSWLSWNDSTVVKLGRVIYEEQRWDDLPILADALEEAGCTDREILDHCRLAEPHATLCWVLVLLLGKT